MSERALVVWDEELLSYRPGDDHPLHPLRLELTMALAADLGLLDRPTVTVVDAPPASTAQLLTVHDERYVNAVQRAPEEYFGEPGWRRWGLGTEDNPVWWGMHEAAALVTGATVSAVENVWSGEFDHAANIAGGLHHAMPARASGFCIYNDPAVAIRRALELGAQRVAYVDVDAHHGDGVEAVFAHDSRVLTVSLHQSPTTLFPGTGHAHEVGAGDGEGTAVNLALPPGTADRDWLRAFHAVVPSVVRAFRPDLLVSQCGCDSHRRDPLTDLALSVDAQRLAYLAMHDLAHEVCGGRWVAVGGGGYALTGVVPVSWAHLLAVVTGAALDPTTPTPDGWRQRVRERHLAEPPERMTDGSEPVWQRWDHAGDDLVDQAVDATRRAVFPLLGLDPLDPRD